jgi:RNA-directed DNA polymerase
MFEDAPVNTGAVQWPDTDSAFWTVRRTQLKLHRWASEDHTRRFGDLFNLVYDPAFLMHAWERVSTNAGARTAGMDRVTVAQIVARGGVEVFLGQIRDLLKSGKYEPVQVRRVTIPKASGKLRSWGSRPWPTGGSGQPQGGTGTHLRGRLRVVLVRVPAEPPAQDAIAEIHFLGSHFHEWVLEADIQACFDEIGHTPLLERVRKRIKDKRVLGLVRAFLKSGVMTTSGAFEDTLTGTPQGGILSPLLANIALSTLDDHFDRQRRELMGNDQQRAQRKRRGLGNWKLVRYADDFVVMVSGQRGHAEALREEAAAALAPMGLRLSPEKTRVVHIDEGFDFLGFHIRRRRKRGTRSSASTPLRPEGRADGQGQGAVEDAQVDPASESG